MVESTTASRTRVVAVAEVDGRRFPLLLLLRRCSSQLRWLRLIWEAVVLEKGTEGEGSVMVCFELAGRGALYRLDGGSSSAWAALGGDRATEGYWHGTRRRTVQRGWAVVKDVTAERGEVSIVHNVSMPGATVDGNPAISSSLQGTGEQGGCLATSYCHGERPGGGERARRGLGARERPAHPLWPWTLTDVDVASS